MVRQLFFGACILTAVHYLAATDYKVEQLCSSCDEYNVQFAEFCCTDINGNYKSVIRPINYLKNDLAYGIFLDGSSIPGCTEITNSDIQLKPDLFAPIEKLPWHDHQIGMIRIICDMYLDDKTPYTSDPRHILKKELENAYMLGYDFYVGPEIEFYLFNNTDNKTMEPLDNNGYADSAQDFGISQALTNILKLLNAMNLSIEKIHHEVGPGQFEISMKYDNALNIADRIGTVKQALSVAAQVYNKKITFMPKPLFGKPGSGMHLNISLYDIHNNCNAFFDPEHPEKLSAIAQSFIAGILRHARELTLILNPSINSYKRLVKGYEAPVYICCGEKNRSALIRLPYNNAEQPHACRLEIRSPDALCNPYLAFAALLKAGMEGIKNNYSLPPLIDENIYTMNEITRHAHNIETLPTTFHEAILAFQESHLMQELLGEHLFKTYLESKKKELHSFEQAVTDWEIEQYR